jgi:regulator of protease activity HflC (stomatin/prohibitin superfamily)
MSDEQKSSLLASEQKRVDNSQQAAKMQEPTLKALENQAENSLCCPSFLSCFCSTVCPCVWCGGCTTVTEKTEMVLLNFGKYMGVLRLPGCYCYNPFGTTTREISTARAAIDLMSVKVADAKGNPLVVSGVVTYQVVDSRKAALDVQDVRSFIQTQGLAVMKRVASLYPYDSKDPNEHSLKTEANRLSKQMIELLQERCNVAGVLIVNFELTDLAYAPEIAQAMLIRQQAEALVDARKIVVEGAIGITHGAIEGLNQRGIKLGKEMEHQLVANLLTVICGEARVQPVVSVGTSADINKSAKM